MLGYSVLSFAKLKIYVTFIGLQAKNVNMLANHHQTRSWKNATLSNVDFLLVCLSVLEEDCSKFKRKVLPLLYNCAITVSFFPRKMDKVV